MKATDDFMMNIESKDDEQSQSFVDVPGNYGNTLSDIMGDKEISKMKDKKRRNSASSFLTNSLINVAKQNTDSTSLKKDIVDLSKTKKRKEFEHDNKIQQKFLGLLAYSQSSEYQQRQTRKVGKKVIGEIDGQIEQLLELRNILDKITREKKDSVAPASFLLDDKQEPNQAIEELKQSDALDKEE